MSKISVAIRLIDSFKIGVKISGGYNNDDEDLFMKIVNVVKEAVPCNYDKSTKENTVSIYYYQELMSALRKQPIEIYRDPDLQARYEMIVKRLTLKPDITDFSYPTLWNKKQKLHDEQKKAIDICVKRRRYILGDDMGIGKTIQAIGIFLRFFDFGYNRVLITVLSSLRHQWVNEILKFTTLKREDIVILGDAEHCINGKVTRCMLTDKTCKACDNFEECKERKQSPTLLRIKRQLKMPNKVYIAGYEALRDNFEPVIKADFDIFIFDEASKLKNVKSKVYKNIFKIVSKSHRTSAVIPMTGTPIENRIQEIYPMFSLIDENIFGNWYYFCNRFINFDYFGSPIGIKNVDQLKGLTQNFIIRRTLAEVWKDRPPFYNFVRECEMSPLQEKWYNKVKDSQIEDLENNTDMSESEIAEVVMQLVIAASSTESIADEGKGKNFEHSAKLQLLVEMIEEELDGKIIVFCHYSNKVMPFIEQGFKKSKINYLVLSPKVQNQEKVKDQFIKDKKIKVLLCSDAVSYGVNLQSANYVIHFDIPWNPAKADQRIGRVYRRGQSKPVTNIYLTTSGTIDEAILNVNYDKRNLFETFFTPGLKVDNKSKKVTPKSILRMLNA